MPATQPPISPSPDEPQAAAPPASDERKQVPWPSFVLLALVVGLLLSFKPSVPTEAPVGEAPPTLGGVQGWILPDGTSGAPTSSGDLDFDALKGEVVFLEFYATWCPPCRQSLKELNARGPQPGLRVIALTAVDGRQSLPEVRAFASQQSFPTAVVNSEAIQAYGVKQIPYALVLGRSGQVVWKGNPLDSACQEAIAAALAQP